MDFETLMDDLSGRLEDLIGEHFSEAPASKMRLDSRACRGEVYFTKDILIADIGEERDLNYYGGFEYIDSDYRSRIGNFLIFSGEDDRVRGILDILNGVEEEESVVSTEEEPIMGGNTSAQEVINEVNGEKPAEETQVVSQESATDAEQLKSDEQSEQVLTEEVGEGEQDLNDVDAIDGEGDDEDLEDDDSNADESGLEIEGAGDDAGDGTEVEG